MKNPNTFKQNIEPKKQAEPKIATAPNVMTATIGRDASPYRELKKPEFEHAPISMRNKNIAWGFSLEKMEFKTFFR